MAVSAWPRRYSPAFSKAGLAHISISLSFRLSLLITVLFARHARRTAIRLKPFYEAFTQASPIAVAQYGYGLPHDIEDWPDELLLNNRQCLKRSDLLTCAFQAREKERAAN